MVVGFEMMGVGDIEGWAGHRWRGIFYRSALRERGGG